MKRRTTWIAAVLPGLLGGCALLSKAEPLDVRYFSPERTAGEAAADRAAPAPPVGPAAELRLGRVQGAADLRTRLAFRTSAHELGYDDRVRWTEEPEIYLRRALSRALFEERGLAEVVAGPAPTLEVELLAFEQRSLVPPTARVTVVVRLRDARVVQIERTLTVDEPLPEDASTEVVVAAVGRAMYGVVDQIAEITLKHLRSSAIE